MPWKEKDEQIRSGHRDPDEFQSETMRTIVLSGDEGIRAIVGKPKGKHRMEVQSYLFDKNKGWVMDEAKDWFNKHARTSEEHVSMTLPFTVLEKITDKPLQIRGVAMTAGISRNLNIYTSDELKDFAAELVSAPVYLEHVAVPNAVGKVTKTDWDGENLWYEAEIYDEDIADRIRKGLVKHVSIGADYETCDIVDEVVPHGLHNAELSLVAVPGIPETNVQILEKLRAKEQVPEPLIAGEYVLGFSQDTAAFMPEHFSTVWLDKENGVLAIVGKLRDQPDVQKVQSIFFAKTKLWDDVKIRDWLASHPQYMSPTSPMNNVPFDAEKLLKTPRNLIPVDDAVQMIEGVLPSVVVERSWGFGPQRLCQELKGVVLTLRKRMATDSEQ